MVKKAAANDTPKSTPAPMTSEESGKARAKGLRLYKRCFFSIAASSRCDPDARLLS